MDSRQDRAISISAILLSVTIFFAGPVYGDLNCVRWEDLAQHLSEKSISLIQRKLCDPPANIQDVEPDRVVSQVIENTFYSWEEFDLATDTGVSMCIVMKKPNPGPLSAQEARVLLTGSTLWRQFGGDVEPLEPDDDDEEEVVIGVDERIRITETEEFPWNTHCALDSSTYLGDGWVQLGRGTGCLVTPYMILTCAHNIYSHKTGLFIDTMTVTPGQTQNHNGSPITPYDTQEIDDFDNVRNFRIAPGFIDNNDVVNDYGVVFLDRPFSGISTYMPLEFSSSLSFGDIVGIAGYPVEVQNEANSLALWDASGSISYIASDEIRYTTDISGGDSGAPIRHKNSLHEPYRIIGIHSKEAIHAVTGEGAYNFGARLGAHNQALITEWMQWRPTIFEETFTTGTIDRTTWTVVNSATVSSLGLGEPSSPYSLSLNNDNESIESRSLDLSSYSHVTLTYWYQNRGGDDLVVEYNTGPLWIQLDHRWNYTSMQSFVKSNNIHLPAMALKSNFKLRFRSMGGLKEFENAPFGEWFIDDIKLMPGPNGPNGMVFVAIDDPGIYQPYIGEMSKYETTNAQYCQFLNAALAEGLIVVHDDNRGHRQVYATSDADYDQPYCRLSRIECMEEEPWGCYDYSYSHITYGNDTFSVLSRDGLTMANHPIVSVSWYGATAFCDYYGYHLPSRLELRAVADYHGTYTYACGTSIDSTKANYGDNNPLGLTDGYSPAFYGYVYHPAAHTSPVGYYPAYGYGLCDMDGNASEWTSTTTFTDPSENVYWGGNWQWDPVALDKYNSSPRDSMSERIGFRVCR